VDPLTQSLLGAAAAQATLGARLGRIAAVLGAVGGELPDLDILVRGDPALPMEYHRHFTHALVFIPAGGALAALPFMLAPSLRRRWPLVLAATTIGCATHGLLDMCTSYGTYLLWPAVNRRLAWDVISIIDPIFTLVLLAGVIWAATVRHRAPAVAALCMALVYLGVGTVQHHRAAAWQQRLAASRGHVIERGRVMPTLGNLLVWRSIYEADGRLHADALRVGAETTVREGTSLPRVTVAALPPAFAGDPRVREVFEAFDAFADGYVAGRLDAEGTTAYYGDMRYSLDAAGFVPLWGLATSIGNPHPSVRWSAPRGAVDRRVALRGLVNDVFYGMGFLETP